MLDAWARRVNFPELKHEVKRQYEQHKPDSLVIESRAAGVPLIQELWRAGIPAYEANPHLGRRWVAEVRPGIRGVSQRRVRPWLTQACGGSSVSGRAI